MDDAHIQTSIDIIYNTIGIYKSFLETYFAICRRPTTSNEQMIKYEYWIKNYKQKIKYEEENLQKLKDKHPEFFI